MELSSFQLEIMTRSPHVAAILNITPNHLDRHRSMASYIAAKANILKWQLPTDTAVLSRDDLEAWNLAKDVRGELVTFGLSRLGYSAGSYIDGNRVYYKMDSQDILLLSREDIRLRGEHNLQNVLAAAAIALSAGLPSEAIKPAVQRFQGVAHRLEFVREWGGAAWYNDSIATAPERSIAALRSFTEPIILLAGGRDKDLPWEDLASLAMRKVRHLVLFGEAREIIKEAVAKVSKENRPSLSLHENLHAAVKAAAQIVKPGEVVLLAPGGTSFDEFKDFEERGECYRKWVQQL
jgi:UDP-N-acetylmuramoylalanine--D-glutamate ligase